MQTEYVLFYESGDMGVGKYAVLLHKYVERFCLLEYSEYNSYAAHLGVKVTPSIVKIDEEMNVVEYTYDFEVDELERFLQNDGYDEE